MSNDTAKASVITADDFAKLLQTAVNKMARPQSKPTQPNIDELRKLSDKAILKHQLKQEKQEKVKKTIARQAPLDEQLAALGTDITPLQMIKLNSRPQENREALGNSATDDLRHLVLGVSPSTREMKRFADISLKLRGSNVRANSRGEVEIEGYAIPRSRLDRAIKYLVKGSRGYKGVVPEGAAEIGELLREQGIASSTFPESIRPLLGGRTGRPGRTRQRLISEHRTLPTPPTQASDEEDEDDEDEDEDEQGGSGVFDPKELLKAACDNAEQGNHDEAWTFLNVARQLEVPRGKLKKVEKYIAALRD